MARYTTILFDADNTLLDFNRSEREALLDALGVFGVQATEEMVATYSRINLENWKRLERGEISKTALRTRRFEEFCAYYGLEIDAARLSVAYTDALSTKSYLVDGALDTCRALAPFCRLYIITNGIASVQKGRFDPSPLFPLFSGVFISEEIGAEKPAPAFFRAVSAAIERFDKERTLVVGDSLSSDMAGGILAGLDTCWYNPSQSPLPQELCVTHTIRRLQDLVSLVLDS